MGLVFGLGRSLAVRYGLSDVILCRLGIKLRVLSQPGETLFRGFTRPNVSSEIGDRRQITAYSGLPVRETRYEKDNSKEDVVRGGSIVQDCL